MLAVSAEDDGTLAQVSPDGTAVLRWTDIEKDAPKRLARSFAAFWSPEVAKDKPSRVTYEIEKQGACCKLSVIHDGFGEETATFRDTQGGWPATLAGIKTLLETGQPLDYDPWAASRANAA